MRFTPRYIAGAAVLIPALALLAACDNKPSAPAPSTPPATSAPAPAAEAPATTPAPAAGTGTDAPAAPAADTPAIGTNEWFDWVETTAGITDGQGHGPDQGSQEWCQAVSFKVYGKQPETTVTCDQVWMADIDARLRTSK
ncbi:hypothetical protein [Kerstersia similis]|uniref:hypothetical protein n=1 Tax=Kerstersia similis TaxID=206505 RepID=UPI0039EF05DB